MEVYIRNMGLHMFDLILARGWQAIHSLPHTRPRRWRWWKWSYTPPSPAPSASSPLLQILSSSVCVCVVGWKRGWCYTEGESGAMRPVRTFSRPPTAGWLSAICELMCNVHIARMGWAPNPINYILIVLLCIDSPISCNIRVYKVYKGHMGHAVM